MISGVLDVSMTPKTNYFYLWSNQDTSKNLRKIPNHFQIIISDNRKISDIEDFENFGKDGHQQIMKIRLIFLKNLNMGSISSRKHEMKVW